MNLLIGLLFINSKLINKTPIYEFIIFTSVNWEKALLRKNTVYFLVSQNNNSQSLDIFW